jgi:hypothetical protein
MNPSSRKVASGEGQGFTLRKAISAFIAAYGEALNVLAGFAPGRRNRINP